MGKGVVWCLAVVCLAALARCSSKELAVSREVPTTPEAQRTLDSMREQDKDLQRMKDEQVRAFQQSLGQGGGAAR